jgi:F0F1-type ATP synthase membrane subunit c/vacuolar-type H+-ATPase subunit K
VLAGLQRLWMAFTATVVVLSVVGAAIADVDSTVPWFLPVGLVVAGAIAVATGVEAVDRGLATAAPATDADARGEVRARLAIQIALAEAPTLLAFALAFVLGPSWVVLVGGAASVATLLRVRPTASRLFRLEEAWAAAGHDISVLREAGGAPGAQEDDRHV